MTFWHAYKSTFIGLKTTTSEKVRDPRPSRFKGASSGGRSLLIIAFTKHYWLEKRSCENMTVPLLIVRITNGYIDPFSSLQGGLSVDSISDLVDSQSRLLEALQLSHPAELELKKSAGSSEGRTQTKLSLNPIYRQVPRVLERCCSHIETHGETPAVFHSCHLESPNKK